MNKKFTISIIACLLSIGNLYAYVPDSIQYKIEYSLYECFANGDTSPLDNIYSQLSEVIPQTDLVLYWMGYTNYYQSIYFLKTGDREKSHERINNGIDLLEKTETKGSEEYTLLAFLSGFSIQFKSGMEAGRTSMKIKEYGEKAIETDSLNVRAWYILGSNDFYTPESFGGGEKTEYYLKKAISLPEQTLKNSRLPSWGKENAYEMLIRFYLKHNKPTEAKDIYESAIQDYPESYMIKQYENKL